jgi:hypothetical protein
MGPLQSTSAGVSVREIAGPCSVSTYLPRRRGDVQVLLRGDLLILSVLLTTLSFMREDLRSTRKGRVVALPDDHDEIQKNVLRFDSNGPSLIITRVEAA